MTTLSPPAAHQSGGRPRFCSLSRLSLGGLADLSAELPPTPVATQHMCTLYELTSQPSLPWFPLYLTPISACSSCASICLPSRAAAAALRLRQVSGMKWHERTGAPRWIRFHSDVLRPRQKVSESLSSILAHQLGIRPLTRAH